MPKCPPFRNFEQLKHVHSRSLLVYKYIIGKITKIRPIYRVSAIAYILPEGRVIRTSISQALDYEFDSRVESNQTLK